MSQPVPGTIYEVCYNCGERYDIDDMYELDGHIVCENCHPEHSTI